MCPRKVARKQIARVPLCLLYETLLRLMLTSKVSHTQKVHWLYFHWCENTWNECKTWSAQKVALIKFGCNFKVKVKVLLRDLDQLLFKGREVLCVFNLHYHWAKTTIQNCWGEGIYMLYLQAEIHRLYSHLCNCTSSFSPWFAFLLPLPALGTLRSMTHQFC